MIDKLETVQQFLLAGAELITALGGPNIVTVRCPAGYTNDIPLIVLSQETGTAHVTGADYTDVVMCKCYGGSDSDAAARAIFRAVYDRFLLPGQTALDAGNIKQVFYLNDFTGPDDPDQGWPNHIGRFQVFMEN